MKNGNNRSIGVINQNEINKRILTYYLKNYAN